MNDEAGVFRIEVAENDELLFSSVQYKNISVLITAEIIKKDFLEVLLFEEVNELDEVNISNINLSGNLSADVAGIEIVRDMPVRINFEDIKDKIYSDDINDPQKAPENLAFQQNQLLGGAGTNINILGVANMVSTMLGIKKPKKQSSYTVVVVPNPDRLRKLFDDEFFKSSIGIQEEYIADFINYLDENGLTSQMLKIENRLALIEYIMERGERYKNLKAGN